MLLHERLNKLRKTIDLTQQEFANKIHVKRNTVAKYELGKSEPSDSAAALICREFNVSEDWLRYGIGEMFLQSEQNRRNEKMITVEQKEEIKTIVNETIKEMKRTHMLKNTKDAIYSDVSERLFRYYKNEETDEKVSAALEEFRGDTYLCIIPLYYKKTYTIENIAEMLGVDTSTVTRNKKRICLGLHLLMEQ